MKPYGEKRKDKVRCSCCAEKYFGCRKNAKSRERKKKHDVYGWAEEPWGVVMVCKIEPDDFDDAQQPRKGAKGQ